MQKFKKLSRAEMKNVTGGGNGNCQPEPCSFYYEDRLVPGNCGGDCNCHADDPRYGAGLGVCQIS